MSATLSLITPVFREPRIDENLLVIDAELKKTWLPYELIVVNDGSDAVTTTLLNSVSLPSLRVFTYAANRGKGFALRYGFEKSSGDLVCFMDADLQLHPQQIALFTNLMTLVDADVVIGSKRHPLSQVEYGPHRRLYSWGFQQLVRILFNLNITDTQVGLKLFRRHVLEMVMPRLVVKKWALDLELLVVAKYLGFNRILEAPVHLRWQEGTSNINWKAIPNILQDTLAVFYRKHIKRHYDRDHPSVELQGVPVVGNQEPAKPPTEPVSTTSRVIYAAGRT